ncbi:hypothetical protein BD769DRAFT_233018 [Suillus cothurnatus]|nr:hypothetical protein BD769DRAFT_233018 [Suillus cothurnatus]
MRGRAFDERRALMFMCHWALTLVIVIPLMFTVHQVSLVKVCIFTCIIQILTTIQLYHSAATSRKIQWYDPVQTMDTRMHCSNQRPDESHQYHPVYLLSSSPRHKRCTEAVSLAGAAYCTHLYHCTLFHLAVQYS